MHKTHLLRNHAHPVPKRKANRDETGSDAVEPEFRFRKKRKVWVKKSDGLTLVCVQSSWRTIIPNTCKVPRISIKRRRRDGVVGVARLELTELVGRVAWLRYLFEPAAGGRGVAETVGESTRASSSTANRRPGWPPRSVQVSTTTFPCALHCPAWRLADVFDACGRPRVQEMVSEDSWHLFFRRRASTPCRAASGGGAHG